jgi:hypothetical protein
MSTGIVLTIDIVINELDALVNIADLETRKPKETNF